ncbi:hypothetical protein BKA70DRAFT_1216659 [Coprinopsis sp. MPI-PUGE-AT-0042]|nr:hypothetical protein BKA70DRAFT_1216659 [Coprinopsis sp. MPI-PUGE-AT-0042]
MQSETRESSAPLEQVIRTTAEHRYAPLPRHDTSMSQEEASEDDEMVEVFTHREETRDFRFMSATDLARIVKCRGRAIKRLQLLLREEKRRTAHQKEICNRLIQTMKAMGELQD